MELQNLAKVSAHLVAAVKAADELAELRNHAESIWNWDRGMESHLVDHVLPDRQDEFFRRMKQGASSADFHVPSYCLSHPWVGMQETYDSLGLHKGFELAYAHDALIDSPIPLRDQLSPQLVELPPRYGVHFDTECFGFPQEQKKQRRQSADDFCDYLNLLAAQIEAARPAVSAAKGNGVVATANQDSKPKPSSKQAPANKRSWTQPDLDAAIREYKARRASNYAELLQGVRAGRAGAKKAAQKMFGRNAVARALGVKSQAMVSKSPEWQAIAEELRLDRGNNRCNPKRRKVGLEIAMEAKAISCSDSADAIAVRGETVNLILGALGKDGAEAMLEKLRSGAITDDQAREIVSLARDQKRDDLSRTVPSNP